MKQNRISRCIYSLLILCMAVCYSGQGLIANTYIVNPSGGADYTNIQAAVSAAGSGDTILLQSGQPFTGAGNKNIDIAGTDLIFGRTGDGTDPIIDMENSGQLFTIESTATVVISNLFIANGSGDASGNGGAITNNGTLTAYSCTFSGDSASAFGGGAIYNDGTISSLSGCTFSGNSASSGTGGAILSFGTISSLSGCTFSGNSVGDSGGAIYNDGTISSLSGCTFSGNNAFQGGAILSFGTISSLSGCTFSGNSVGDSGGAIYNGGTISSATGCTFSGNSTTNRGGAIYNQSTISSATGCTFSGNSAPNGAGGAIFNFDTISSATGCTFSGNNAFQGGAIYNDSNGTTVAVNCSRFAGNTASSGSALYANSGPIDVTNNWWGSNSDPSVSGLFGGPGSITFAPWMEVALNVTPLSPLPGQTSAITADFTKNSSGASIMGCHIPDGVPVNFSTNQGIISPTSAATVNGIALTTLTPNNQSAQVCALVGPGHENFLECSVTNSGFNRLNWGCICGEGGDNGVFIGAYADSAGIANRLMGWTFDGTSCTKISSELAYTTTSIINHVVYNELSDIFIGILAQPSINQYRVDLARFDNTHTFVPGNSLLSIPGVTTSKIQFILDAAGNLYAAVDTSGQISVLSLDKNSLTFINSFTQTNLNSTAQSNFLYWYVNNNGLYLVQGYNNAGVPTVATYKVTLDPVSTVIETGIKTDISAQFTQSFCCSTCSDYLVLGGTDAVLQGVMVPYTVNITGSLIAGTAITVPGAAAVYYTERCCCNDDHLLVGTDNGLFSYSHDLSMIISSTSISCINTCWCCKGDNRFCAAVTIDHGAQVFKENGTTFDELCTLVP